MPDQTQAPVALLASTPETGSPNVRDSPARRYGPGIRKLSVSSFVIVCRYDGEVTNVLAMAHGRNVA